jgi:tetratricopeptide (TPR) repeat protein
MGDFSQAIDYHTQHLAIAREVGDRAGEGGAYGNLGNAHDSMGDFSQAIAYYTQCLTIARELGDWTEAHSCSWQRSDDEKPVEGVGRDH